jgi:lipopolysaccharide transport protein LptA
MRTICLALTVLVAGVVSLAAQPAAGPRQPIEIFADHFEFSPDTRLAVYKGNVRVNDAQMDLSCELLTVKMAEAAKTIDGSKPAAPVSGKIESIVAEKKVVLILKQDKSRATGDKAVYTASADSFELTGTPLLERTDGNLSARLVVLERAKNSLRASGDVRMKYKPDAMSKPVIQPGTAQAAAPRQPIEIAADEFLYGTETRLAVYRGKVRVNDAQMDRACETLTVRMVDEAKPGAVVPATSATGGKISSILAEQRVVMVNKQDGSRATGDKAVYTAVNDSIELTGSPKIERPDGDLTADLVTLDRARNSLKARGNVHMKYRPDAAGKATPLIRPN